MTQTVIARSVSDEAIPDTIARLLRFTRNDGRNTRNDGRNY